MMGPYFDGAIPGLVGTWFVLSLLTWLAFLALLILAVIYLWKKIRQM